MSKGSFTVREPVDFVALAPVLMGFYPTESVVMMTLGKFNARVSIPPANEMQQAIDLLLDPAKRHMVEQVVFIVYGEGDVFLHGLERQFQDAGINVVESIEVINDQFRTSGSEWEVLDLDSNHITLEAKLYGLLPRFKSREEMAAYIQPRGEGLIPELRERVDTIMKDGINGEVFAASRETAKTDVNLWMQVLRGVEPDSEESRIIALVLAFVAWLAGDGALAWVALDLGDPTATWHRNIAEALIHAHDPSLWTPQSGTV